MMKGLFSFSNYYISFFEKRILGASIKSLSVSHFLTHGIILIIYFFAISFYYFSPFISYLFLLLFIVVHFYCWWYKKKVPYVFPNSNIWQDVMVRCLMPFVVIFAVDSKGNELSLIYYMIVCIVCFFVLQRIYQKGFYGYPAGALRYPQVMAFANFKIPLSSVSANTKVFYNEYAIFILSFLLPFQNYVPFDIQRVSIFLFSFNCFLIFLIIPSTREVVSRIFRRLSRALALFAALAGFTFFLALQIRNLYFMEFPNYFSDLATSLKTLAMIISGEFFAVVSTNDTELFLLVFFLYSFLGIILLSFFTAFLVDSDKSYKTKWLLGRINHKNTYLELLLDNQTGKPTPIKVFYNSKEYFCSKEDLEWYNTVWSRWTDRVSQGLEDGGGVHSQGEELHYTIADAFFLIGSKEIISEEEEKEILKQKKTLVTNKKKRDVLLKKIATEKDPINKQKLLGEIKAIRKLITPIEEKMSKLDNWWNTPLVRDSFYKGV